MFALSGNLIAQNQSIVENLTAHLNYLASDELGGRRTKTEGAKKASEYVFNQFESFGLNPEVEEFASGKRRNIVSKIPSKNGKYILLGAHYDGEGTHWGKIHNAADDNASGTSVLIELARFLKDEELEYGVIFVAFDGEEVGLLGSSYNAKHINSDEIALMISIDMVGHLEHEGRLIYEGSDTFENGKHFIEKSRIPNLTTRIYPVAVNTGLLTDTFYYDKKGIPALNVLTGVETSNYHAIDDNVESLDISGMALITEHLVLFVKNVQNQIKPTGIHLYGNAKTKFEISGSFIYKSKNFDENLKVGCMVPVSTIAGLGDVYIKPEIGVVKSEIFTDSENVELLGAIVPFSFVSSIKADKLEIIQEIGPYYSILFDTKNKFDQELGIKFSSIIKACNNCVNYFNNFGIGFEVQIGFPQIFPGNTNLTKMESKFGVLYTQFF